MSLQSCYIVRIYLPISSDDSGNKPLNSSQELRKGQKALSEMLDLIAQSDEIGRLGSYDNVYELSMGEEWYTPLHSAKPTKGREGVESGGKVIVITTYAVHVNFHEIENFIDKVANKHPWEHPVIECLGPSGPMIWMPKLG